MKKMSALLFFISLVSSNSAFALDMDFYTYGGFSETVLAFQRISLFFQHDSYAPMIFIAAVFAFMFGGTFFFTKTLLGENAGLPTRFILIPVLGVAIYQAIIVPRGNVHIYDPTMNTYQAVGNVPNLVILLSGGWNKLERMAAEIESDSSAFPYEDHAGAISFQLLFGTAMMGKDVNQHYLSKSIKTMFKDCSEIPLAVANSGFDLNTLKSGTTDIIDSLDNIAWANTNTTYYDLDHKSGQVLSCQDAWVDKIKPALNEDALYAQPIKNICAHSGFNPGDATQLTRCKAMMDDLGIDFLNTATSHKALLRMSYVASLISESLAEENPDIAVRVLTNRDMITDGIGAAINSQEWVSTFRSVMLTVILGLIPILAVFLATQFAFKSLFLMSGLFAWAAMWGIVDVVANGIAIDQALSVMDDIKAHNLGLDAWLQAPTGAMKAIAIFGKIRGYGATISTIIVGTIFGFSAYSLSSMSDGWQRTTEKSGADAADKSVNPEQRGQQYENLSRGQATESTVARTGFEQMASAASFRHGSDTYANMQESQLLQNAGMNLGGAMAASGAVRGGENAGSTMANMQMSGVVPPQGFSLNEAGATPMANTAMSAALTQRAMSLASNEGIIKASRDTGVSATDMARSTAYMGQLQSVNDGRILESMPARDILSGYYGNALSSINGGKIMDHVASQYEGGKVQFFEDMATTRFGADYARFATTAMLAERMDKDLFETSIQMNSSGFSMLVTPQNVETLQSLGLIDAKTYSTLAEDGFNGRIDYSFDPNSGTAMDITTSSGARATSNNSETYLNNMSSDASRVIKTNRVLDNSRVFNDSETVSKGYSYDDSFNVGAYTVSQLTLDPSNRKDLGMILDKTFDDPDAKANALHFDTSAASLFSTLVSRQASESANEQSSETFNRSVGANIGIEGKAPLGPIKGTAGASASMNYQWSDSESDTSTFTSTYQVNLSEMQQLRIQADEKAHDLAKFSTDHDQDIQTGVYNKAAFTEEEYDKKYEEYLVKYRAEAYAIEFENKLNETVNNLNNVTNSELSDRVDELTNLKGDKK